MIPRSLAPRLTLALIAVALFTPLALRAGTPLICHPYDIGEARSLPGGNWKGADPKYDRRNLTRDTLALLQADTPILVRMETLRRAAIYATAGLRHWEPTAYSTEDHASARELYEKLQARTRHATGADRALAIFDAGFFVETLRHARLDLGVDGYALLAKAGEMRPQDPEIEFALALASSWPNRRDTHPAHLQLARAGAPQGSLLAANLDSHFGR